LICRVGGSALRRSQQQQTAIRRLIAASKINCEFLAPDRWKVEGKQRDRCAATQNHARRDARSRMQAAGRHVKPGKLEVLDIDDTFCAAQTSDSRSKSVFQRIAMCISPPPQPP
jgi:hypothetical protein